MKGNKKVLATLNDLLAGELTAIDQYFIHGHIFEDMGLTKLYEHSIHEMEEEQGHARLIIQRMLFLEGHPDLTKRIPLKVGKSVPEMLKSDLAVEYEVIKNLKAAIALCESVNDYQTRQMLLTQLADSEEDHAYWLEQQLRLIDKMGLENYLQSAAG